MQELGMIPLTNGAGRAFMHSALPDSPVVPDRPPGRLRVLTAAVLHRIAVRLEAGDPRLRRGVRDFPAGRGDYSATS